MELLPYGQSRIALEGSDVQLNARQALALGMVVHELATNAAKYGALSAPTGRLAVRWSLSRGTDRACRLCLVWDETGGPPAHPPTRRGFGSRLIHGSVAGALRGQIRMDYRAEGLLCEMEILVEEDREPLAIEG